MNPEEFSIENIFKQIREGLNSPLEVSWIKSKNEWRGNFIIENNTYEIQILNFSDNGHWLFKFTANDKYELTNDIKKAYSVIPTIHKAAVDFVDEISPEAFIFCASDKSSSRKKIYTRFCEDMEKSHELYFHTERVNHLMLFMLLKPLYDGTELALSTTKIIRNLSQNN